MSGTSRSGGGVLVDDGDDDQDEGGQPQQVGPTLLLARHVERRDDRLVYCQQPERHGEDREQRVAAAAPELGKEQAGHDVAHRDHAEDEVQHAAAPTRFPR